MATDDDDSDDLSKRLGKFLDVEKIGTRYKEVNVKGEETIHTPDNGDLDLEIEELCFHTTIDASSGAIRPLITGKTRERFRAIGTEGEYRIYDVKIGSDVNLGAVVIRDTYFKGGHAIKSSMMIGLSDDAIRTLSNAPVGRLRITGIKGLTIYGRDEYPGQIPGAMVLPYWREHVVESSDHSEVAVEWRCTFTTATYSPNSSVSEVQLTRDVGIFFRSGGDHPLISTIEGLTESNNALHRRLSQLLIVGVIIAMIAVLRTLLR